MQVHPEWSAVSEPADPDCFTGPVWRTEHLPRVGQDGLIGHRFLYGPGARSHWHVHEGDQALIVVGGRGLAHWTGLDAARPLLPGDWVHVDPGVEHWHGAAADEMFVHLAVTASGGTEWLGPVSDADYQRAQAAFG